MFTLVTCPTCQHKFTVPEAAMGKRHTCPSCQSPFLAGKSVGEADAPVPMRYEPAPAAAFNKTMLGETAPPITYNCPRCKKPLESPAIEAGTKKPCPSCGQRLQVPAAPPAAAQPNLNKTILASDESKAQLSPIVGVPLAVPGPAGAATVPASPPAAGGKGPLKLTPRMYAIGGVVGGGILLLLLACVATMLFSGPSSAEREKYAKAQQDFENAKKELETLKKEIQQRETVLAQQKQLELEHQRQMDKLTAENKQRQDKLDFERTIANNLNDEKKAAQAKALLDQQQRDIDAAKMAALQLQQKNELELKTKLATLEADLAAQKQRATTIINQPPPPVYYYPPYSPYAYWPWR
jgi:DNA-directed RNA polymerase subunit RPC12/RpoP